MIGNIVATVLLGVGIFVVRRALKKPLWRQVASSFRRKPFALVCLSLFGLYSVIAIADSYSWASAKNQPPKTLIDRIFERPQERTYSAPFAKVTSEVFPKPLTSTHWLGTDGVGNDVIYMTLKGVRTAYLIGGLTTLIVIPIALLMGMLAGYYGKAVDDAIQYFYTVLDSIPGILLLIAIMLVLGQGVVQLCVALGITSWVSLCRLVRGETLKQRDREYVVAARAFGLPSWRILLRHIMPNLMPVVIISGTLGFSRLILSEAILSYLHIGVPEGTGSWGNMIDSARLELAREPLIWWNLAAASFALFVLVFVLNVLGDALRDGIDPRLRIA